METQIDHTHLLAKNSANPPTDVHAIAVTLTETKHLADKGRPAGTQDAAPDAAHADSAEAERRERIAIAAYFIAERRGFAAGHEMEDWIAAEHELEHPAQGDTPRGNGAHTEP